MSPRCSCLLLSGSALAVLGLATPAVAQSADGNAIEEIVVTAQKREQSIQDVPVSITALTQTALEANRIANVGDLNAVTPNLTVRQTAGGSAIPAITLRGALSIGVGPGADREVGYYVDGVYIGHANGSMFDLADIQRIEVLRGPQGTLFGRNATAGAISIVTQDPKGEFGLKQEFSAGNYDYFRSKTRLDLPALGPVSASLTYIHSERRGEIRNLGAGTVWDFSAGGFGKRTSPKWLGNENTDSIAAAVKVELSPSVDLSYKFDWMDFHGTPNGNGSTGFGPPLDGGLVQGIYQLNQAYGNTSLTPITNKRPDAVNNSFTTPTDMRVSGHNFTAQWRANETITLKNILAFRKARQFASYELSGLGGMFLQPPLDGLFQVPAGTPFLAAGSMTDYHHKQFSDELQLNIDTRLVTVTAGAMHYFQRQLNGGPKGLPNVYQFAPVPGFVLYCPPSASGCPGQGVTRGKSDAAYIQAELHATSQIDIVGGFRVTHDDKSGQGATASFKVKGTNESYLAGVNYRPADGILLFAKYSTAFMSGGGNTGNFPAAIKTYKPETAKSWEAGIKSELFNRRLQLNLTAFTVKYGDLQFITSGQGCGDPSAGVCVYTAGDSKAKGFELEATAAPVRGLTLNGGLGYTDTKYKNLGILSTGATGYFDPRQSPKWTANMAAQYDTPKLFGDTYLTFRLDANYRSTNLMSGEAPPQYRPQVTVDPVWMLNGRVALTDIDFAGHKGEIALWGKNLTDNKDLSWVNSYYFLYPTSYERARTLGVDVKFEW